MNSNECNSDLCQCQHNGNTVCANGCGSSNSGKLSLTMVFKRESLLYDIAHLGYVEGEVQEASHATHQTQDIIEDGNGDRITRVLDLVYAECQEMLMPYSKQELSEDITLTDEFKEADEYTITLSVPKTFSRTTAVLLKSLIHEYMVARALYEWLSITKPKAAEVWLEKTTELSARIESNLNNFERIRERPLRPVW